MSKNLILAFRANEDEKEFLESKAKKAKRKLSDFMRCELLKDKNLQGWDK